MFSLRGENGMPLVQKYLFVCFQVQIYPVFIYFIHYMNGVMVQEENCKQDTLLSVDSVHGSIYVGLELKFSQRCGNG